MRLDDGSRNGEAQAAMLAERLALRPDRLEAAEDRLTRFLGHARAFVLDADDDILVAPRGCNGDEATVGREG